MKQFRVYAMKTKPSPLRKIRLFVASPGDVHTERSHVKRVVDELNTTAAPSRNCFVELVRWETHCNPGMGRPQGVIKSQIFSYDIFLGIMWRRFGTPTVVSESGTEEEFLNAFQYWKAGEVTDILFYFNQAPFSPTTEEELQQCGRVLRFRRKLESLGLAWEYRDAADFPDVVRPHLYRIILNLPDDSGGKVAPPQSPFRVFIGSSLEGIPIANRIRTSLEEIGFQAVVWTDRISVKQSFFGDLDELLNTCHASVMILTSDYITKNRRATLNVVREKLAYELGLFHGRHGRGRTFVLATSDMGLPSDLSGVVYLRFDVNRPEPALSQLGRQLLAISSTV